MAKSKRPSQNPNLLKEIYDCVIEGRYYQTKHALQRQNQRKIGLPDVLYVLKTGHHEKRKTTFDEAFLTWKYAIRGKTFDDIDIRVVVAFDEKNLLIITVINLSDE